MDTHPSTSGDPSWMWGWPEPAMPPGLNREQAWAWAMDNFPALSRHSCDPRRLCRERSDSALGLLRRACTWHADDPGAERGQKRCRDSHVRDPVAESVKDLLSSQEEACGKDLTARWDLNQPGDTSTRAHGERDALGASLSPNRPHKRLKTQAY